ncbi:MAG: indolepyruvate oxidoreductase subunit beta [Bacteroidales bacterium]|nr:indolepyruvate oxidoreductase subunit beta [Bacteroidales bacterium]
MKKDIILAGVGGQGILSIATVIGEAALKENLNIKQAEVHGMSQRGGDVQSNLRISSDPIASDLIPKGCADLIISLEPMEALRYLPYLSKDGWIVTNTEPFVNIPNYPAMEDVNGELARIANVIKVDVDAIAKEAGNPRGANIVLLGACSHLLGIEPEKFEQGIERIFSRKGQDVVDSNLKAFRAGQKAAGK